MSSSNKLPNDKNKKKFNQKGIIITLLISVGIIGASFIVWLLPTGTVRNTSNGNNLMVFTNPNDTLQSVNTQYMLVKNEINNQIKNFTAFPHASMIPLKNSINASIKQNNDLMQTLLHGNPPRSMLSGYVNLMTNLKNFSFYLDDIKNVSDSHTTTISKDLLHAQKKWSIR
ncbi:MAG TPA: hypothetical protein VIY08_13495 [Candidatus Nitrosocosmicus sp.]